MKRELTIVATCFTLGFCLTFFSLRNPESQTKNTDEVSELKAKINVLENQAEIEHQEAQEKINANAEQRKAECYDLKHKHGMIMCLKQAESFKPSED